MPLWKAASIILDQQNGALVNEENEDEEKSEEIEFLTFTHSNFLTFTRDPKRVNLRVKGAKWGS